MVFPTKLDTPTRDCARIASHGYPFKTRTKRKNGAGSVKRYKTRVNCAKDGLGSRVSLSPQCFGVAGKAGLGVQQTADRHFRKWLLLAPAQRMPAGAASEVTVGFLGRKTRAKPPTRQTDYFFFEAVRVVRRYHLGVPDEITFTDSEKTRKILR